MSAPDGYVLAQLLQQGRQEGADLATLRAIAEEAGEQAASRALARLGLGDIGAEKDVAELRALLAAWRDAKRSVWKAALGWLLRLLLALVLTGLALRFGFAELVR